MKYIPLFITQIKQLLLLLQIQRQRQQIMSEMSSLSAAAETTIRVFVSDKPQKLQKQGISISQYSQ